MPFLGVDKVRSPGLIHYGPRFKRAFQAPQVCPTLAAMSHIQHQRFPRYMLVFLQLVFHALTLTLLVHIRSEDPRAICMHQHVPVRMCAIPRAPHFLVDQASDVTNGVSQEEGRGPGWKMNSGETSGFSKLAWTYLLVYVVVMGADWWQVSRKPAYCACVLEFSADRGHTCIPCTAREKESRRTLVWEV